MIAFKLRLRGIIYNHKKVYRIYKQLGLNLKHNKKSKKIPARKRILELADNLNKIWSLDFMSGSVGNKKFRTINIIDDNYFSNCNSFN
jgi:putative transposase